MAAAVTPAVNAAAAPPPTTMMPPPPPPRAPRAATRFPPGTSVITERCVWCGQVMTEVPVVFESGRAAARGP
eukprot:gene2023-56524_t